MKKQTYIAFLINDNGNKTDFERFACKRVSTVKKYMLQLLDNCLYKACCNADRVKRIEIYATPDGIHAETMPADIITLD